MFNMAPKKTALKKSLGETTMLKRSVSTRAKKNSDVKLVDESSKRKAVSPLKQLSKRSAFGDITNDADLSKKIATNKKDSKKNVETISHVVKKNLKESENGNKAVMPQKKTGRSNIPTFPPKVQMAKANIKPEKVHPSSVSKPTCDKTEVLTSVRVKSPDSTDNELYLTAVEELGSSSKKLTTKDEERKKEPLPPPGVEDFDAENMSDPVQVSEYAMDIFSYLKEREAKFVIDNYMERQTSINTAMRALLVDWLVEIQENFELNHETLYLAVKLTDIYLSKVTVSKETLQLVGAAAIFIASKYDERMAPMLEEMLYVCDGAYDKKELIRMEINILNKVGFELGIPLSYRFLRRYARCSKVTLPVLTLARYILELSLMEYTFVSESDSKLAAAALLLALKMKEISGWTKTLQYYSGYSLEEIKDLVFKLNDMLKMKPKEALSTVRNKYSHKIFFEVAKEPVLAEVNL
ncbi:G2/mitotic-specific cyclin-B3 isoform X1 [Schistocerca gregaria]|uniref:G2/mitotic-specific cyclin-B3 isoform X1 n=1 Tax=Schistocerca gregaria TaxID=7010 RepID=UPI00211DAE05|nr:G2/mitotic-specific cyclin-B3 isoform X1 [Schistocerca gregaria]XP_049851619.1 G2/mitotic-specific cyclin-B3 isoform X1 [Schistocerca gregaria]